MIRKAIESLRKRGPIGMVSAAFADLIEKASKCLAFLRDHCSGYRFIDRRSNKATLIVVLAGYKPYLWPATLSRLERYAPRDADFCVASAGLFSTELADMCARNGWSYLSVGRNSPGVALNKAIGLHPSADFIYKLDEDVVIGREFFRLLREGYDFAWQDSLQEPGFCAPVLNVNGISYRAFLRELRLESDYETEFGKLFTRCDDLPVHNNPATAWWLWRNTLPFDEKAERFAKLEGNYTTCSTRFSIGAILFRRAFMDKVGGFKSSWHSGVLGVDEDMLCRDCVSQSRPMYIVESALVGHFSFYPQEALMREKLPTMSELDPVTFPPSHYSAAVF
jgi:hypothetical protein